MARQQGFFYDENGKFIESRMLEEREVWVTETYYEDKLQEVVTEEKLCELHQSIKDGTYEPVEGEDKPVQPYECPNCIMYRVDYETVKVPYTMDVYKGKETIIPENCTLEQVPDGIYYPYFDKVLGKWIKTVEPKPPEPEVPQKSELELLKERVDAIEKVLDTLLLGGAQ